MRYGGDRHNINPYDKESSRRSDIFAWCFTAIRIFFSPANALEEYLRAQGFLSGDRVCSLFNFFFPFLSLNNNMKQYQIQQRGMTQKKVIQVCFEEQYLSCIWTSGDFLVLPSVTSC